MKGYNKYHNRKVRGAGGIVFDSVREARRWHELKLMEAAGKITRLERQKAFELLPSQKYRDPVSGKVRTERGVTYIADFVYVDEYGERVVEDTKGVRTPDYVIKRKMMLWFYQIHVVEV